MNTFNFVVAGQTVEANSEAQESRLAQAFAIGLALAAQSATPPVATSPATPPVAPAATPPVVETVTPAVTGRTFVGTSTVAVTRRGYDYPAGTAVYVKLSKAGVPNYRVIIGENMGVIGKKSIQWEQGAKPAAKPAAKAQPSPAAKPAAKTGKAKRTRKSRKPADKNAALQGTFDENLFEILLDGIEYSVMAGWNRIKRTGATGTVMYFVDNLLSVEGARKALLAESFRFNAPETYREGFDAFESAYWVNKYMTRDELIAQFGS